MSSSRKTIFDLERRNNFTTEYKKFLADLDRTTVLTKSLGRMSLIQLLNDCMKIWPYRQAANSIASFTEAHGFSVDYIKCDDDILYGYELFLNLLYFAPTYDRNRADMFSFNKGSTITEECRRCIENIEYNLEMINMRVREIATKGVPQYVIFKRDAQVDAIIESVPELSEVLLSYLDMRNRDDVTAKKAILKAIADYLEPKRKNYKGTIYSNLCEDLFTVFNNATIRHQNEQQWKLSAAESMKLCDKAFKAAIHLLQREDVEAFHATVKGFKEMN